jgi:hypothetical protein
VKKLTCLFGLLFYFSAQAAPEANWKTQLRGLLTKVGGADLSTKILGAAPVEVDPDALEMPTMPQNFKKSTDVASYTKKIKEPTEYDKLPSERKRQFNYKFLEELFVVTRKTEARDEDLSNWLNTLDQGGSREGIYQALVLDEVYAALENIEEKPSKQLLSYCMKFSQKFLNQTVKEEALQNLNLYSLKRILTERGLDLLEYYETNDLDSLNRWYAHFSADLGKEFSPLLHSQIRKEASRLYHYEWAKGMPIQHIKSEFIIKMHTVMNGLQLLKE